MKKFIAVLLILSTFYPVYKIIDTNRLKSENQEHRIEKKIYEVIQRKHDLKLRYVGCTNKFGIKTFCLKLERKDTPLSINEYRLIIVDCIEEALTIVNADPELRPYLFDYPCSENNIQITIFLSDSNGLELHPPHLSWIAHYGYKIHYYYDDYGVPLKLRNNPEEPYQEALKIYKQHQAGLNSPQL